MSQAPMPVPNGSGKAVRLGFNAGIQAAQTLCYGDKDPLVEGWSVPGMFWVDSNLNLVKQLNQAGTTWVVVGTSDPVTGIITWTNTTGITAAGASMSGALKFAAPVGITSVTGVLTLTDASNSFVVAGNEAITSITGWTQGIAYIRWGSARTLTHGTNLILQGAINRVTKANDIGVYEFNGTVVREVGYFPSSNVGIQSSFPLGLGNYIAEEAKIESISDLTVNTSSGVGVINNTPFNIGSSALTLDARSTNLIYAKTDGTIDKVKGVIPTSYIDDNTLAFWIFNQTTAGANVPNSAVGVSATAVANDLVPHGGITSIDGWCDYASKLDGTTGYFTASNTTNFPSGGAEREYTIGFHLYSAPPNSCRILGYGVKTSLYLDSNGQVGMDYDSVGYLSGFHLKVGAKNTLTIKYLAGVTRIFWNGRQVNSPLSVTANTTLGTFSIGNFTNAFFSPIVIDYVEVRNKVRDDIKTAEIANKYMLPVFYSKSSAVYPTIPSTYTADYHEYKFDETSGTAVADSNTATSLNGTATGTTIVDSDINLGKARKYSATEDRVMLSAFACGSSFSYVGVINMDNHAADRTLWSNRNAANASQGLLIYTPTSGELYLWSAGTGYAVSDVVVPTQGKVFIAVVVVGTSVMAWVNGDVKVSNMSAALPTNSLPVGIGYDAPGATNFLGTIDYTMFGNFELSTADVQSIYSALMITGRRSIIEDVLPSNTVALAFARTNSTKIIEYNDVDYRYGRREGATGGNRKVFLGWKAFSGNTTLSWGNPFGTGKIKREFHWAQDTYGTNEMPVISTFFYTNPYGIYPWSEGTSTGTDIYAQTQSGGVSFLNGVWQKSGYLGVYVEVMEDFINL